MSREHKIHDKLSCHPLEILYGLTCIRVVAKLKIIIRNKLKLLNEKQLSIYLPKSEMKYPPHCE